MVWQTFLTKNVLEQWDVVQTNDTTSPGYYNTECTKYTFKLKYQVVSNEYTPTQIFDAGKLVCYDTFWNKLQNNSLYYRE